jgi:ABC-type transport system involved in multi-copper enzyme maturation permease subunit
MIRAFRSEWLKIWRPAMILGGAGPMIGFAVLAVVLSLSVRLDSTQRGPGAPPSLTAAQVAASDGFASLQGFSTTFIGVVALAVWAIAVGSEYSNGTLRNLLVRQPARLRLLAGNLLALGSFVAVGALLACAAALASALLLLPAHYISASAWFTSTGVGSLLTTAGNLVLATLAWGALGAVLAIVLRSTAAAIAIGLAYVLVAENLLAAVWSGGDQWLPGQLLDVLSKGGTTSVAYGRALVLVGLYVVVAMGAAFVIFRRRDVAA